MNKKSLILIMLTLALTLTAVSADAVRIGLRRLTNDDNTVVVKFDGAHTIYDSMQSNEPLLQVESANHYRFSINNGVVSVSDQQAIFGAQDSLQFEPKQMVIKPTEDANMSINGVDQIGDFLLGIDANNQLIPVVVLEREQYLRGVVPKEMSPSAPLEALKAQAVAARTFSIRQMNRFDSDGYDICDSPSCQVYGGAAAYNDNSDLAVESTVGLCVAYRNYPANTFYHANSGGYVENSEDIFASPLAYITADQDPYSLVKSHNWSASFTLAELSQKMDDNGYDLGAVEQIEITEKLASGRVVALTVSGDRGETTLKREKIRSVFGYDKVKSLLFSIEADDGTSEEKSFSVASRNGIADVAPKVNYAIAGDNTVSAIALDNVYITGGGTPRQRDTIAENFVLRGRGWGHGLGMSQVGAMEMAKQDFDFRDILKFYYKNTEIISMEDLKDEDK